jgi:ribokinase
VNDCRVLPGVVVVVGSINEDVVLHVPRQPRPGETLSALSVTRSPGGKGANQAAAAARQGAPVQILGRVGGDPAGGRMVEALGRCGVDTRLVEADASAPTGSAYILLTPDGESTIVLEGGANQQLSPDHVRLHALEMEQCAVLLVQMEVPTDTVVTALDLARKAGVRRVLNLSPPLDLPEAALAGLDPLVINQHEAAVLLHRDAVGIDGAARAATELLLRGPASVVLTLGPAGCAVATPEGSRRLGAPPVAKVVDTTGAGDALAGTLAATLAGGSSLLDAVHLGQEAAALAVGRMGAR